MAPTYVVPGLFYVAVEASDRLDDLNSMKHKTK